MFYHLTLNHSTGVSLCVPGSFTSSERHREVVLLRGPRVLELWILIEGASNSMEPGKGLKCVCKQVLHGEILSMKPLRPPGADRDYLVASTKEGEALILIFDLRERVFIKVYTYCSQARRSSQLLGHFVATDPRGRAFIMGAKENIKVVHSVKLDQSNINLSFIPFDEDEKVLRKGLTYDIVFLYDESDRDIVSFASTEIVFKDSITHTEKEESYENFDRLTEQQSINFFDINLKTRKVKLRWRDYLKYKSNFLMEVPGGDRGPGGVMIFSLNEVAYKCTEYSVRCPIPRRITESAQTLLNSIIFINCTMYMNRDLFYYLAQTELGDIFKISLAKGTPIDLQMQYFCTLPLATALCILEPDCIFVAYESGDHALYTLSDLSLCAEPVFSSYLGLNDHKTFFFKPSEMIPESLHTIPSLCPLISMPIVKPSNLFAVCGSYGKFILKSIVQRMQICSETEIKVEDCPQKKVIAVKDLNILWSCLHGIRLRMRDLIILSYAEKTVVFELKGRIFSKVDVPDISTSANTLACRILNYENYEIVVQITSQGIHTSYPNTKWRTPQNKRVEACALNNVQAILLLDDTSLHYVTIGEHARLTIYPETIKNVEKAQCILLSNDTSQADFSLIGTRNNSIFVISLRPDTLFQCVFKINELMYPITALLSCRIGHQEPEKLKVFVGLFNGDLWVTHMDKSTGILENIKKYHLGSGPIKLFDCGEMVMIITNYTWLYFLEDRKVVLKRLYSGSIETACNLREPNKFLIFSHPIISLVYVADLNPEVRWTSSIWNFQYNPHKIVFNPKNNFIFFTQPKKNTEEHNQDHIHASMLHGLYPFPPYSCPYVELEIQDAVSCSIAFTNDSDPLMLISSKKVSNPSEGVLHMYVHIMNADGSSMIKPLHRIELDAVPTAIEPFGSSGALVGIGKEMRIYYCDSKLKLAGECKCVCAPTCIVSICTNGNNILVQDSEAGFVILKYSVGENKLKVFAHDLKPVRSCCFFDQNSIAKTDKFGNISIIKYYGLKETDPDTREELQEKLKFINDGPKAVTIAYFSVGEVVLSMQMASLYYEGLPVLLYSTISGSICIIAQIQNTVVTSDDEFILSKLEKFMLLQNPVISQDPKSFRAPHSSIEKIVNGDLCEQYSNLGSDAQDQFAKFLKMLPEEIIFRLVEIRSNFIF